MQVSGLIHAEDLGFFWFVSLTLVQPPQPWLLGAFQKPHCQALPAHRNSTGISSGAQAARLYLLQLQRGLHYPKNPMKDGDPLPQKIQPHGDMILYVTGWELWAPKAHPSPRSSPALLKPASEW